MEYTLDDHTEIVVVRSEDIHILHTEASPPSFGTEQGINDVHEAYSIN